MGWYYNKWKERKNLPKSDEISSWKYTNTQSNIRRHFTTCSHTFTLFCLRNASGIAKISQVSMCLFTFNWRSHHFSGEFFLSFHLLTYLYFGTFLSTWVDTTLGLYFLYCGRLLARTAFLVSRRLVSRDETGRHKVCSWLENLIF